MVNLYGSRIVRLFATKIVYISGFLDKHLIIVEWTVYYREVYNESSESY